MIRERFSIVQAEEEVAGTLLRGEGVGGIVSREDRERYILLSPPAGSPSVVCLLGARWELTAEIIKMSLYLHLFGQSQLKDVPFWHRGYRLEMPHGRGVHDYQHVQPVKAAGWPERVAIPFAEQDVPDSFPAFPLRGNNLTTLCAVLAISLCATELPQVLRELRGHRMQHQVRSLVE